MHIRMCAYAHACIMLLLTARILALLLHGLIADIVQLFLCWLRYLIVEYSIMNVAVFSGVGRQNNIAIDVSARSSLAIPIHYDGWHTPPLHKFYSILCIIVYHRRPCLRASDRHIERWKNTELNRTVFHAPQPTTTATAAVLCHR
jgi:hypothetical protein